MERIDNPPAFPVVAENGLGHVGEGMSLRDWFAGQALIAMGTWSPDKGRQHYVGPEIRQRDRAEYAYAQADAMLRERAKGGAA